MPAKKRIYIPKYTGVYYIEGTHHSGKPERIYYIMYRQNGKLIEEKAGKQYQDDMTPARAARIRASRIDGAPSNKARRDAQNARRREKTNQWTVGMLWGEYLKGKPELKGKSIDEIRYRNYIKPAFGNKEPKDIAPLDVDRLVRKALKGKSPKTIRNVLELLRRIINFGERKQLCPGLSFVIEMPKVNNEKTEALTDDELKRLLHALDKSPHKKAANILKLALYTGMRRGEIFNLQWQDVDFEHGFIKIRNPKSGKDTAIPLNNPARELLESVEHTDNSPFVFPGRHGKRLVCIRKYANEIIRAAGLPKGFRAMHGLRHSYASMLASEGVDLYTISKLLTHSSTTMTARYSHLSDKALKEASGIAGRIVSDAKS